MTNAERQKRHRRRMAELRSNQREQIKARPPELAFRIALWQYVKNYRILSRITDDEVMHALDELSEVIGLMGYYQEIGEKSESENVATEFLNPYPEEWGGLILESKPRTKAAPASG